MNDELFAELVESVREGGAIMRGEKEPSRKFVVEAPNVESDEIRYRQQVVRRVNELRERLFATYGEMTDSVELIRADRAR
jgi:hypothetical protein